MEDNKKIYEIGFNILPLIAEENLAGIVTSLKDILENQGAIVVTEEFPKLRPLAYTIRKALGGKYQKFNSAYFGWVKFEAPVENAKAIEKAFALNENILRSLLIATVRESTLAPQKAFMPKEPKAPVKTGVPLGIKTEAKTPVSEEELDKKIDQLVAE